MKESLVLVLVLGTLPLASLRDSYAQGAWVAPKGTGFIGLSYQNNLVDRHAFGHGEDYLIINGHKDSQLGETRFQSVYLDFGYSLSNKLGISVSLPYTDTKYTKPPFNPIFGPFGPHKLSDGSIPLDNG